jgi:chromosome segregation ATPase
MSLWEERAARNEALFREVNERVEELHDKLTSGGTAEFVCECADETCTERLALPLATYERVRKSPLSFS